MHKRILYILYGNRVTISSDKINYLRLSTNIYTLLDRNCIQSVNDSIYVRKINVFSNEMHRSELRLQIVHDMSLDI